MVLCVKFQMLICEILKKRWETEDNTCVVDYKQNEISPIFVANNFNIFTKEQEK